MNKLLKISTIICCLISTISMLADFQQTQTISTVAQALTMPNSTTVTLMGKIITDLKHDNYIFQDRTGTIQVTILPKDLENININSNTRVKITADVKTFLRVTPKLRVKAIEVVEERGRKQKDGKVIKSNK